MSIPNTIAQVLSCVWFNITATYHFELLCLWGRMNYTLLCPLLYVRVWGGVGSGCRGDLCEKISGADLCWTQPAPKGPLQDAAEPISLTGTSPGKTSLGNGKKGWEVTKRRVRNCSGNCGVGQRGRKGRTMELEQRRSVGGKWAAGRKHHVLIIPKPWAAQHCVEGLGMKKWSQVLEGKSKVIVLMFVFLSCYPSPF